MPMRVARAIIRYCAATTAAAALCFAAPASAEPRSVDLVISNGSLPADQRLVDVAQGDVVALRLASDKPVEFHLHGYDIEEKLLPGATVSRRFLARAAGRFPLEVHGDFPGGGKVIGYLEVRPR